MLVVLSEGLAHIRGAHTGCVALSENIVSASEVAVNAKLQEMAHGPSVSVACLSTLRRIFGLQNKFA